MGFNSDTAEVSEVVVGVEGHERERSVLDEVGAKPFFFAVWKE